jgi:hypothetical protein
LLPVGFSAPTQLNLCSISPTAPAKKEINVDVSREPRAVRTTRERAEEKRQEKLEQVREQVESGSLVIRQMTEEERQRYPPRPEKPNQPRRR